MRSTSLFQIEIYQSHLWQLNSALISYKNTSLLVDPGYFPVELERLVEHTKHKEIQAVVFTHGHFDHVLGSAYFPSAPVWVSPALQHAVLHQTEDAQKNRAAAEEFDGRYYIQRPRPFAWPQHLVKLSEGTLYRLGDGELEAVLLPGHSQDGLGLLLPEAKTLLVGDYLSSCEIPFVEDAKAYHHTLHRFLALIPQMQRIIPGHGPPLSQQQAQQIIEEDLRYVESLLDCVEHPDRTSASEIPLPRAKQVPGMKEEHLKNCHNLGLSEFHR